MYFKGIWITFWRDHRKRMILAWLMNGLSGLLAPVTAVLLAQAVAMTVGRYSSLRGTLIGLPEGLQIFYYLVPALLLYELCDWAARYMRGVLAELLVERLRKEIFSAQFRISPALYTEKGYERYLLRHSGDLSAIQQWIDRGLLATFRDLVAPVAGFLLIGLMLPKLALVLLLVLTMASFVLWRIYRVAGQYESEKRDLKGRSTAFVANRLRNIQTIWMLNKVAAEQKRHNAIVEKIRERGLRLLQLKTAAESLSSLAVYSALMALFICAWRQNAAFPDVRWLSAGFIVFSWRGVLRRLFSRIWVWEKKAVSVEKLDRFFSLGTVADTQEREKTGTRGPLVLQNLELSNGKRHHLTWTAGQRMQYLIESESERRDFLETILGFKKALSGNVLWAGAALGPSALRRRVTVVSDSFPLYGKNLLESIAYTRKPEDLSAAKTLWRQWQSWFSCLALLPLETSMRSPDANLTKTQARLCQLARACLSGKPFVIMDTSITGLSIEEKSKLEDIINGRLLMGYAFLYLTP